MNESTHKEECAGNSLPWKIMCEEYNQKFKTNYQTQTHVMTDAFQRFNHDILAMSDHFRVSYTAMRNKLIRENIYTPCSQPKIKDMLMAIPEKQRRGMTRNDLAKVLNVQPASISVAARLHHIEYKRKYYWGKSSVAKTSPEYGVRKEAIVENRN